MSEETKKRIEDEIQKVIDEGYERAEKIISENMELLKFIAEKLMKEEILSMDELDKICENYLKFKQKNN